MISRENYICNLLIPGAAKSGSSSLHNLLQIHPDIEMSCNKEPHFFSSPTKCRLGAREHNSLFSTPKRKKYYGESSTSYLIADGTAQRIKEALVEPKFIFLLRDPVQRTISHYQWRVRLGLENRSLVTAISEDGYKFNVERPTEFGFMAYLQYSNYSDQCSKYEQLFGCSNCLYINSQDFRENRQLTFDLCCEFLSISNLSIPANHNNSNETRDLKTHPTKWERALYKNIPVSLRENTNFLRLKELYRQLKKRPDVPNITQKEIHFLREALKFEIEWFNEKFRVKV